MRIAGEEPELYVLARSRARIDKERAMRKRQLKRLWKRLGVVGHGADDQVTFDEGAPLAEIRRSIMARR